MEKVLITSFLYSCIAVLTMVFGCVIAQVIKIRVKGESAIQHFAAGVVFAAVAVELIPRLSGDVPKIEVGTGFILGVICMLLLKIFTHSFEDHGENEDTNKVSKGMIFGISLDLFIDGILIGLAFLAGEEAGILIAIALAIETLSLGLALSTSFKKAGYSALLTITSISAIALWVVFGAAFSLFVLDALPHYFDTVILAFGAAALLYLVTEELLVEAHEIPDTPWITAMFFLGFLSILLIS